MPRASRRYYSEDDPDHGVTPSQLKRLGKARQIAYMRFWFHRNFEDPANETPRDEVSSSTFGAVHITHTNSWQTNSGILFPRTG